MDPKSDTQQDRRDRNARLAVGICIGLPLGVSIGLALGSIPIGIAIGTGAGVSLGLAFSRQRQEPSRPFTIAAIVALLLGIIVLAVVMHLVVPSWWCDYPVLSLAPGC